MVYYVSVGMDVYGGKKAMRKFAKEVLEKTERGEIHWKKNEDNTFTAEFGVGLELTVEKGNCYWFRVSDRNLPSAPSASFGEEPILGIFKGPVEKLWRSLNS